ERPIVFNTPSLIQQGLVILQHQTRLPKHVSPPYSSIVPFANSSFVLANSSAVYPSFRNLLCRGQGFTGRQQKASALKSPSLQTCLGALYQPIACWKEVTFSTSFCISPGSSRTPLATETISAPRVNISFAASKSLTELFPIRNSLVASL